MFAFEGGPRFDIDPDLTDEVVNPEALGWKG
jgi:hypothetical protein